MNGPALNDVLANLMVPKPRSFYRLDSHCFRSWFFYAL